MKHRSRLWVAVTLGMGTILALAGCGEDEDVLARALRTKLGAAKVEILRVREQYSNAMRSASDKGTSYRLQARVVERTGRVYEQEFNVFIADQDGWVHVRIPGTQRVIKRSSGEQAQESVVATMQAAVKKAERHVRAAFHTKNQSLGAALEGKSVDDAKRKRREAHLQHARREISQHTDSWGGPLVLVKARADLGGPAVLTIRSDGPDRRPSTADDIVKRIKVDLWQR